MQLKFFKHWLFHGGIIEEEEQNLDEEE